MVRAMTLMSRRALLALPALAAPKRKRRCKVGMQPDQSGVFFQLIIVGGGEFTYDASGNLRTANVGQTTTDPLQGITCYAGFSTFNGHGAVISLFSSTLDAQLWYADTGSSSQGILSTSVASSAGTDPFGNAFVSGVASYGSQPLADLVTTSLRWVNQSAPFSSGPSLSGSGSGGAANRSTVSAYSGKPQLGSPDANLSITSLDGGAAQAVIATGSPPSSGATTALLEVKGSTAVVSLAGIGLVFLIPSGVAATDTAAVAAVLNLGATPVLCPGTWNINCGNATLTTLGPGQYIVGCGDLNTIINAQGSGDLFRWVSTTSAGDLLITGGGIIGGATIDGAACSGAAIGIHAGDINALRFDCRCQNFNKTGGSWGFLFDNQNFFTERLQINIRARSCGFAGGDGGSVGFNVGGATTSTGSFARLKGRIEITTATNQRDGLVLTNGAHIYDCDLEVMGNFSGGASATTAAALRITGTVPVGHPGAGTASSITNGRFEVGLECGTGANTPTTFIQGTSSNGVRDCYGNVNWNNNFTSSGITGPGWRYDGQVQGDASLGTRRAYGTAPTQTITANGQTILVEVPSAKIPIGNAGAFTGLILTPGNEDGQLVYLINTGTGAQQFAVAGTSNVAAGVGANLSVGRMLPLIWDAGTALWYSI